MKVYIEKEYQHRTTESLVGSLVSIALGGMLIWFITFRIWDEVIRDENLALGVILLLVLGGIAVLFSYSGCYLLHGWIKDRRDNLRISSEGISHYRKFTHWSEIKRLSFDCKKRGELVLFFQKNGWGFNKYLPVTEALTAAQIEELFSILKKEVSPHHRGLNIG